MRLLVFIVTIWVIACNSEGKQEQSVSRSDTTNSIDNTNASTTTPDECYMHVIGRDSFFARLNETGDIVNGQLEFRNYQKDKSRGSVHGTREGDLYKLWYDFESEGMKSVMEVYFKKEGDELKRGLGPVDVKGDTSYFTDHSKISYNDQVFKKVTCQ